MSGMVADGRRLSHAYGRVRALDEVSLAIPSHCMAGLIGPDGVGKSTLLALMAGVRRLQTGTLRVLQGDLRSGRDRRALCPRIAYMPQGLGGNLYPTLSVRENIDFFARLFGQSREERDTRIVELLAATGLAPFSDRPAAKLSGGMKQKLGLCCALIHDPDLLILDEPTTGVDPLSRRQFWELMERIRERSEAMSVIVATAYMEEAERFDWLAMLDAGHVLATGRPEQLRAATGTPTLEEAYVALLPGSRERDHRQPSIPVFAPTNGAPAIETRALTKRFGTFTAVDRVSFRIARGEIFGFIGSNGCGKTTTMKMLTGLLPATEGEAFLFDQPVDTGDLLARRRVGYMSQAFSLYTELTVRQNLQLHAHLFELPREQIAQRIDELLTRFGLSPFEAALAGGLPLGIRQRLSLAVAVIHEPQVLILDEPTSGVDPIARDTFWEILAELARDRGITIFISTHFMNEASRCDRIALMHAGRVLACAPPAEIVRTRGSSSLEEAFISILEEQAPAGLTALAPPPPRPESRPDPAAFRLSRLLAYTHRELLELRRDPFRIGFALLGPMLLMMVLGFGISLDTENIPYTALDLDQSPQSHRYLESFEGSRYFEATAPAGSIAALEERIRHDEVKLGLEIPPHFGRDLRRGRSPEVAAWIDGAVPFRAETIRGYVQGVHEHYLSDPDRETGAEPPTYPFRTETRFRYNQEFRSIFAIVPGVIAVILFLIPAVLSALGVVREKELGSITNFYATPVTRVEFLAGKQLPYAGLAVLIFLGLVLLAVTVFGIPLKGSATTLFGAALLYAFATTGFGLLVSSFVRSQMAALVATAILTVTPSFSFSGLLVPVSSLTGASAAMAQAYPVTHFLQTSVGAFTKALGFQALRSEIVIVALFVLLYWGASTCLMHKQEH